jgi:predicted lipoprotein with Yx(FWY)xxD motif
MRIAPRLLAAAAALSLLVAACGDDDEPSEQATTQDDGGDTTTTAAATGEDADVAVAETDLGEVLVDAEGNTLYMFDNDSGGTSSCEGGCAEQWPPLETEGEPAAGEGADAALLGTTDRSDGTTQVTYDGLPLYTYAPDGGPGDTTGQGVGDVWWVVAPDGEPVRDAEGAGAAGGSTTTAAGSADIPGY